MFTRHFRPVKEIIRCFRSLANPVYGSSVKQKLFLLQSRNKVSKKTGDELKRQAERRAIQAKRANKRPYSKQKAQHILKLKHGISPSELSVAQLGPTSKSDLRYLTLTRDKRMLYTLLGVTGSQLRDSKLVAGDVEKFLRRGQLEKAIFLARLAHKRGVVGMNLILEYVCKNMNDGGGAIDLYNWRKKWGIELNEFTNTVLFSGLANLVEPLSDKQARRVFRIAQLLIEKDQMNQIEFNAALKALSNSINVERVFELFELKPKTIHGDKMTYQTLLTALKRTQLEKVTRANILMAKIPPKLIDFRIALEYCRIWGSYDDRDFQRMALSALQNYFALGEKSYAALLPTDKSLPQLAKVAGTERFPVRGSVLETFIELCLKTEEYELATKVFENWKSKNERVLTCRVYELMINVTIRSQPNSCTKKVLELFEALDSRFRENKSGLILVYKAFERQAARKFTNGNEARLEVLLSDLQNFASSMESYHGADINAEVLQWKVWLYYWKIVNSGNTLGKICLTRAKFILDQFINTVLSGQIELKKRSEADHGGLRHIELESVRFISAFADRFRVQDLDNVNQDGAERECFLFRRSLLRLKTLLLEHLRVIEGKIQDVSELECSINQCCVRLRAMPVPPVPVKVESSNVNKI
ncbi:LAMI_0E10594g1_1 [Lachancea mirantina]|uniref:LAMI_0E10594g1_1 n=1 Tax=Lachancea mirantina TaxID=1230905 RepID=A0A1G4JP73_9SACH|nr:LAMI_0E10594g1_1 [Lachancea mirantina]